MKSKVVSYGTIDCAIWTHPAFRKMSDDAKMVFVYLKTSKHQNMIGAFHCPDDYMLSDLGDKWKRDYKRLDAAKLELTRPDEPDKSFCLFCEETEYVYLNKHLDKFPVTDINRIKGSIKIITEMPRVCRFTGRLAERMSAIISEYSDTLMNKKSLDESKRQKLTEDLRALEGALKGLVTPSETPMEPLGSITTTATTTTTAKNSPSPMDGSITKSISIGTEEPFQ